jgi:undecaprenyl pyrophosphate phosphatase UppP
MALHIHLAIFATVFFVYRHRVGHIYQQNKLRGSRRQFDTGAILDGKVVISMLVPASLGLLLSNWAPNLAGSFPRLIVLLTVSGILLYIPHFLPSGNRDSNHLSRLEAILFGFCAGLSVLPGLSWMGGILAVGSLRGCSRTYLLDMALLLVLPLMLLQILLDLLAVLAVGFAGLTWVYWLQCLAAGIAAFLGASVAIGALRFLSINRGYTGFAYYNWGLAIFSFILYLMI